jgi:protein DEK
MDADPAPPAGEEEKEEEATPQQQQQQEKKRGGRRKKGEAAAAAAEKKTPPSKKSAGPAVERPSRERKTVERYAELAPRATPAKKSPAIVQVSRQRLFSLFPARASRARP